MTGETQLRARRTRIKILRAIADRNGVAGFSDIKFSTGLSTGSIYYHLERMGNYVTKDSKHYMITEEGLQLLREVDPKYVSIAPPKKEEERTSPPAVEDSRRTEETVRQARHLGIRRYAFVGAVTSAIIFALAGIATNWQALTFMSLGVNTSIAISVVVAAAMSVLMLGGRRTYPVIGYRGMTLSVVALAGILVSMLLVSGLGYTGATPSKPYDNSMDALLSSYSLHWHIR